MMTHTISISYLDASFQYLASYLQLRLKAHFEGQILPDFQLLQQPYLNGLEAPFNNFVRNKELTEAEYLLLLIAFAPHYQANFFDTVIQQNLPQAGDFPQLGGVKGKQFRGFLPTAETALFILGGTDIQKRFALMNLFSEEHFFAKEQILWLEEPPEGEPRTCGKIVLSQEYVELFTQGKPSIPKFSMKFPAQLLDTSLEWEDLILHQDILAQIKELEVWIKYGDVLMNDWQMGNKLKPGYRVLFHGPPGTGKTLTASLLGKYTGKQVFKIDLSMVVSKFIGETEKNLANLFARAENKDWVLFFDEADALFGKRTNVKDAHDKYANQEVSYLLQRVESYNGLVILASNFKNNIDEAFVRRFQSIIHFPLPQAEERLKIWEKGFPSIVSLAPDIALPTIAKKYELSGAEIMNVIQYACLKSLSKKEELIHQHYLLTGIQKEYQKEGRIMR